MEQLQIAVEGPGALEAARALLDATGLSGTCEPVEPVTRDLMTAAAVIGIVAGVIGSAAGTVALAEQIRRWYREWSEGGSEKRIDKVVLIGAKGERLVLKNATADEIVKILDGLAPKK